MTTTEPSDAGSRRTRPKRGPVGRAVARSIREAADGARPLLVARRLVVQHLADALDDAMVAGNVLLVVKLNGQLETAIVRAELDGPAPAPAVGGDHDHNDDDRSLDDELADLAADEPTLGDPAQA